MSPLDFSSHDRRHPAKEQRKDAVASAPTDLPAAALPLPGPVSPQAPTPATLADLLSVVQGWADWSAARRRVAASNIRTAGLVVANAQVRATGRLDHVARRDVVLAAFPCDPKWLNAHLFGIPPKAIGINPGSFSNVVSTLRSALRRVGLVDPQFPPLPPDGDWRRVLDMLQDDEHSRFGLTGFANWCHATGIAPDAVTDATLRDYGTHITARSLHDDIPGLLRTIARAWSVAGRLRALWPQAQLRPPSRRETYTLPIGSYPPSLQREVEHYKAYLAGTGRRGPFRADAAVDRRRRPTTVRARLYQVRQGLAALVQRGRDPASITTLADLVEPAAFETILTFFWERAIAARVARGGFPSIEAAPVEAGITSQTGGIGVGLLLVAKYLKVPQQQMDELSRLAADVRPPQQRHISDRNLARLRQFDDPAMRHKLLNLPRKLMKRAEATSPRGKHAAQIALKAVAIEMLLHIPMRLRNLTNLRLGEHLKVDGSRAGRITHLVLRAHETKNEADLEWSVGPDLATLLDRYLRHFHPLLAVEGSTWLFPAPPPRNAPLSDDTIRYHIVRAVRDEIGAESNPHLFRSLLARLILEESPGALEDVRHLLGDKSDSTVLRHYASIEPAQAARRHGERLAQLRLDGGQRTKQPKRAPRGRGGR